MNWDVIFLEIIKAALFAGILPCQTMYAAVYACFSQK